VVCQNLSREKSNKLYKQVLLDNDLKSQKELCKKDLFYLLTIAFKRKDVDSEWLYDRCREVEANPDGYLDLWAREHYKSTIITFAKSIQDILCNPDVTIGIFSHTRPIAKGFLDQIKRELETNTYLKGLFPEILYDKPHSESPKWSLDSGIIVKRKTNPKECTIEAHGLVDGQPTSKHFSVLVYDDVVTRESVTTPDQIKKVTGALELSYNLGAKGGVRRFIGTRYHVNDSYRTIMDRDSVIPRIYPATDNGKVDGKSVFLSDEDLKEKRRDMGPYTFGTQMLQDPIADKAMGFREEWLHFYQNVNHKDFNYYLLIDPAGEKKKTSDYTVMVIIGLGPDENYYLIDMVRERMNLTQRADKLFELHREYKPLKVGYEKYGMQSDIEHMKYVMEKQNYRFGITPLGGNIAKEDRIRTLIPIFEQSRFYLPKMLSYVTYENQRIDLVKAFIDDEYLSFPVCVHDDMLDCIARITDKKLGVAFPEKVEKLIEQKNYNYGHNSGWLG